jgi:hypothetical protein
MPERRRKLDVLEDIVRGHYANGKPTWIPDAISGE